MDPGASTSGPSDGELVRRILAGDRAAEYELDRRWRGRLFGLARSILRGDDLAEDAAQLAMWRALRSLRRYNPSRPFEQWILAIGRNTARDLLRREKARAKVGGAEPPEELPGGKPDGETLVARQQELAALRECMETLQSKNSREIVALTMAEFSQAEIGRMLDCPATTIGDRLRRALEHLRPCMEGRGFKEAY